MAKMQPMHHFGHLQEKKEFCDQLVVWESWNDLGMSPSCLNAACDHLLRDKYDDEGGVAPLVYHDERVDDDKPRMSALDLLSESCRS